MTNPSALLSTTRRLSLALLMSTALVACDETGNLSFGGAPDVATEDDATSAAAASSGKLVERDVEAPSVFQVTEPGLWDGRPSLGGVWVAHPSAVDPERVIIRNPANGKFVIGALFRRERENPGPALQVSSDAAEALGMLAGSPVTLNVTALRKEEALEPVTATATTSFEEPAGIAATPLDPIAGAAAAITAAETAPKPKPRPAATSSLKKPFIQIGIFSIEANARRTAERMKAANLNVRVLAQNSNGRDFWRVIVGPAQTSAGRSADLAKIKALGFNDAYAVTN